MHVNIHACLVEVWDSFFITSFLERKLGKRCHKIKCWQRFRGDPCDVVLVEADFSSSSSPLSSPTWNYLDCYTDQDIWHSLVSLGKTSVSAGKLRHMFPPVFLISWRESDFGVDKHHNNGMTGGFLFTTIGISYSRSSLYSTWGISAQYHLQKF